MAGATAKVRERTSGKAGVGGTRVGLEIRSVFQIQTAAWKAAGGAAWGRVGELRRGNSVALGFEFRKGLKSS